MCTCYLHRQRALIWQRYRILGNHLQRRRQTGCLNEKVRFGTLSISIGLSETKSILRQHYCTSRETQSRPNSVRSPRNGLLEARVYGPTKTRTCGQGCPRSQAWSIPVNDLVVPPYNNGRLRPNLLTSRP